MPVFVLRRARLNRPRSAPGIPSSGPVATPRAVQAVLSKPAVQKQIMELGMDLTNDAQKDFAAFDRAERAKWAAFMKASGDVAAR